MNGKVASSPTHDTSSPIDSSPTKSSPVNSTSPRHGQTSPLNMKRRISTDNTPNSPPAMTSPASASRRQSELSTTSTNSRDNSPQHSPSSHYTYTHPHTPEKVRDDVFEHVTSPSAYSLAQVLHLRAAAEMRVHWMQQHFLEQHRMKAQAAQQQYSSLQPPPVKHVTSQSSQQYSPPPVKRSRIRSFAIDDILRNQQETETTPGEWYWDGDHIYTILLASSYRVRMAS